MIVVDQGVITNIRVSEKEAFNGGLKGNVLLVIVLVFILMPLELFHPMTIYLLEIGFVVLIREQISISVHSIGSLDIPFEPVIGHVLTREGSDCTLILLDVFSD